MSGAKNEPQMVRVPLSFDCSDETQRMVCEVLRSAGYGKRTPIVVKAVCLLMGQAGRAKTEEGGENSELAAVVRAAVADALREMLPKQANDASFAMNAWAENEQKATEQIEQEVTAGAAKEKSSAADQLAGYDLPEDIINSALAFVDQFG